MKNFLGALLAATIFTFAQSAAALTVTAELIGFESADASMNGGGQNGGIGTFRLTGGDSIVGTDVEFLGRSFEALCLEPNEYVTTGNEYIFNVVDLSQAPTSNAPGMGTAKATTLLEIMELGANRRVEDITGVTELSVAQMAAWEASQELITNGFNIATGTAVLTGVGDTTVNTRMTLLDGVTGLQGFALLNVGELGSLNPQTRSVYRGQDFMVFSATTVPSPMPLALMGLGMLGLIGLRKNA